MQLNSRNDAAYGPKFLVCREISFLPSPHRNDPVVYKKKTYPISITQQCAHDVLSQIHRQYRNTDLQLLNINTRKIWKLRSSIFKGNH